MEAGLEHLSWAGGTLRHVDLLLIVAQPQVKSLLTAARTVRLARQLGIPGWHWSGAGPSGRRTTSVSPPSPPSTTSSWWWSSPGTRRW